MRRESAPEATRNSPLWYFFDERARGWLLEPHPALGGQAPVYALANSYDAERVEDRIA